LALFGRRPSVRGDSFVIPASENLHNTGSDAQPISAVAPLRVAIRRDRQSRR